LPTGGPARLLAAPPGCPTSCARIRVTTTATLRTIAEIAGFFSGTDLLAPGVVQYHQWNPGEPARDAEGEVAAYRGLGRKP